MTVVLSRISIMELLGIIYDQDQIYNTIRCIYVIVRLLKDGRTIPKRMYDFTSLRDREVVFEQLLEESFH